MGHSESPAWKKEKDDCCAGQSQAATQGATFGDQTAGEQKNDADVTQKQGNANANVPARRVRRRGARVLRHQVQGLVAAAWRRRQDRLGSGQRGTGRAPGSTRSNSVTQTQEARQFQPLAEWCKGLVTR